MKRALNMKIQMLAGACILALSACGGGMGGGGDGGSDQPGAGTLSPIEGTSREAIAPAGIVSGQQVAFSDVAFKNSPSDAGITSVRPANPNGLFTMFFGRSMTNGLPDTETRMSMVIQDGDRRVAENSAFRMRTEDNREGLVIETSVEPATINGHAYSRTKQTLSADGAYMVAYTPTVAGAGHAGMIHNDQVTALFGAQSGAQAVAAQHGSASYSGVAEAATYEDQYHFVGRYTGSATANVNFDRATFSTQADLDTVAGAARSLVVTGSGSIANGRVTSTGLNVNGVALDGNIRGTFYGPNAENLGYVFDGVAPVAGAATPNEALQTSDMVITGGALLSR